MCDSGRSDDIWRIHGGTGPRCSAPPAESHPCPYKQEIEDDEALCTCCKACEAECSGDI